MTEASVTKSEFATLCNVDRSRVSHWIRDRKIDGGALVGEGRDTRIVPSIAQRQLRARLDSGQRAGNGLGTKLRLPPPPQPATAPAAERAPAFPPDVWAIIADLPSLAAWHVASNGGTMEQAFSAYLDLIKDLREAAERVCGTAPPAFAPVNWRGMAEEYGHPYDLAAWRGVKTRRDSAA